MHNKISQENATFMLQRANEERSHRMKEEREEQKRSMNFQNIFEASRDSLRDLRGKDQSEASNFGDSPYARLQRSMPWFRGDRIGAGIGMVPQRTQFFPQHQQVHQQWCLPT